MGIGAFAMRGFTGPQRLAVDWLPPSSVKVITQCSSTSALHTVKSLALAPSSTGTPSMLRIPSTNRTRGDYFISFRTAVGQDTSMPYANKIGIHRHTGGSAPTKLWKYLGSGTSESTNDGLTVAVEGIDVGTSVATVRVTWNPVTCAPLSPSPRPPSPTPSPNGQVFCGRTQAGVTRGAGDNYKLQVIVAIICVVTCSI
eukprot:c3008_g1_i1.p1 GENE.c3008_g1_i1~~c3008_g1_i1.p1  ORF type:complete len:199 (-),score=30.34 c3008_g1_i1:1068-1664(-)